MCSASDSPSGSGLFTTAPAPNSDSWASSGCSDSSDAEHDDIMQRVRADAAEIASTSGRAASTGHSAASPGLGSNSASEPGYTVVNFYHLCKLMAPGQTAKDHKDYINAQGWDIRGRIYMSYQGVNAQFSGPTEQALAYANWVAAQAAFKGVVWRTFPATRNVFPKLRLKYRPNLISLYGGMADLPVTDPAARATPLDPDAWAEMLAKAVRPPAADAPEGAAPPAAGGATPVVLDVRNSYEWDAGHFAGAARPLESEFNDTPRGEGDDGVPQYLRGLDPDTPVMMYCTGGIRCDIYSTFLKQKGFNNLYTLEGGIQNYLYHHSTKASDSPAADTAPATETAPAAPPPLPEAATPAARISGDAYWKGSLYVFDERMAVGPADWSGRDASSLEAAVGCQLCGSPARLPHLNCANVDCNLHFLCCDGCRERLKGACCEACRDEPPRLLRPVKDGSTYKLMSSYTDGPDHTRSLASPQKVALMAAMRERRKARVRAASEERRLGQQARKQLAREMMAKLEAERPPVEQSPIWKRLQEKKLQLSEGRGAGL